MGPRETSSKMVVVVFGSSLIEGRNTPFCRVQPPSASTLQASLCMSIAYDCWRLSVSGVFVGVWIDGIWNGHFLDSDSLLSEAEICGKIPEFQHSPMVVVVVGPSLMYSCSVQWCMSLQTQDPKIFKKSRKGLPRPSGPEY